MHRKDFRCLLRLRVRWAEVDMQKIVFNGHYLTYIDTAMSEYWRAVALPYEAAMQVLGGEMVVKKATLEYHAPARVDDALQVGMRCAHLGNSSCRFIAAIFRDDKLLVSRARKIERFFSQPMFVAEQFTNIPGKYVPLRETVRGFREILDGKHDDLPEQAFHMVGTIEDAVEKAQSLMSA